MVKQRLSREQSRQLTRQRLLEAAASVIPAKGYQAASVEDIANQAGYSRGAFYSNFADKDALFLALLEQLCEQEREFLDSVFEQGNSVDELRASIRDYYAHTCTESHQFMLYTEAQVHALRHPAFRQQLIALERITRERISGFVARYFIANGQPQKAESASDVATGLMALTSGISFAQILDPEQVTSQQAVSVLLSFFDAIAEG